MSWFSLCLHRSYLSLAQAAAAVKISLILKFPTKSEYIFAVDIKKLWEQAKSEGVPFHEVRAIL